MLALELRREGQLVHRVDDYPNGNERLLYRWCGKEYLLRIVGKQYGLTDKQAPKLAESIKRYHGALSKINVCKIPDLLQVSASGNRVYLLTECIREQPHSTKTSHFYQAVISTLIDLSNRESNISSDRLLKVSVDSNPMNFLFQEDRLTYIDFTPPLLRHGSRWVEYRRLNEKTALKKDKVVRLFSGSSVVITALNRIRLFTNKRQFDVLVKHTAESLQRMNAPYCHIFEALVTRPQGDYSQFLSMVTERDLHRFTVALKSDMTPPQFRSFYSESKLAKVREETKSLQLRT